MINKIKKFKKLFNNSNKSKVNLLDTFPSFVPNSKGSYKSVEKIIIQNINNSISAINNLKSNVINYYLKTSDFPDTINAKNLKNLLDNSGSDKANHHDYHKVYNFIIEDIPKYALNTWEIVCNLLNDKHYVRIVEFTKHFMFICKINSKEIRTF